MNMTGGVDATRRTVAVVREAAEGGDFGIRYLVYSHLSTTMLFLAGKIVKVISPTARISGICRRSLPDVNQIYVSIERGILMEDFD